MKIHIILLLAVIPILVSCSLLANSAEIEVQNEYGSPIEVTVDGQSRTLGYGTEMYIITTSIWTVKWQEDEKKDVIVEVQAKDSGQTTNLTVSIANSERRLYVVNSSFEIN